jgi:hypothetical protein
MSTCSNRNGCQTGVCADFVIKRHDTQPSLRIAVADCDGVLDLSNTNLVLEANMWCKAKLKTKILPQDTYFRLADDIGFEQVLAGDIIIMDRIRQPEHMLVTGFDETNRLIQVQRAYHGSMADTWARGNGMRIFRMLNAPAKIEMIYDDILDPVTGETQKDQLVETYLKYDWLANDTCVPGCFLLEFKLLKMTEQVAAAAVDPVIPSFTPSNADFDCSSGLGVEWVRRFPVNGEGFVVQIVDSPTAEL